MNYKFKTGFYVLAVLLLLSSCRHKAAPPKPFGPVPSPDQLAWNKMEYYMFVHFGPNTFTNREWGTGKEDPKVFNPLSVNCEQWAATAKAAGMKGIVLTAKHHDGFCLWPSKFSTHTVRESPWKKGKGDLVAELSKACKKYGLKFGVYLSPWDRNHPQYGTPGYNRVFANTLTEVLKNYGDVFEQWFDGACGEGPNGKKQVYDWSLFNRVVKRYQPHAIIFGGADSIATCRWVGNERGRAGKTEWSVKKTEKGLVWMPNESDVSIRPGWFYSPSTDDKVKSVDELVDIYFSTIGRNSNLILNVPPDRSGRINGIDSSRLMAFHKAIVHIFQSDLAKGASVTTSDSRGYGYEGANLLDDNYNSYWTTKSDTAKKADLVVCLPVMKTFNRLLLQEYIPLGQRISAFKVYYKSGNDWLLLTQGTTIGYKRLLRFPSVRSKAIKIEILDSKACPILNSLGLYMAPERLSKPQIMRNAKGVVRMSCLSPDPKIYYTLDGSHPSSKSYLYQKPFLLPQGGEVRAVALVDNGKRMSDETVCNYDLSSSSWRLISGVLAGDDYLLDGNPLTVTRVHVKAPIIIRFDKVLRLKGLVYTPALDVGANHIYKYRIYTGLKGSDWHLVKAGVFDNVKNNPILQKILFKKVSNAQFVKIKVDATTLFKTDYEVAEIGVVTR